MVWLGLNRELRGKIKVWDYVSSGRSLKQTIYPA